MNYLEQTYLKQINQLQKELNVLKHQEKTLSEQNSFETEKDAQLYAQTALDSFDPANLVRDAANALVGSMAVRQVLGKVNLQQILQKNMTDFIRGTLEYSLGDIGNSLANTLVNAAGRNPFQLAKAISVTRYNPYAIFDPNERTDGTRNTNRQNTNPLNGSTESD